MAKLGRPGPWLAMAGATQALYLVAFSSPFFLGKHYSTPQLTWLTMAGYRLEVALAYTAVIIALFGIYYLAYRVLAAAPALPAWAIYLPPVAFAMALLAIYPADGWDLFAYISQGRTLSFHHLNPFLVSPQEAPQDIFFAYSSWVSHPSIYGPVWVVLSSITAYLGGESLWRSMLLFKAVPTIFLFASVALVYLILRKIDPSRRDLGAFLLAWNPLVLFEVSGNGHNDIVMVFFALLSLYFLVTRGPLLSFPSLAVSALAKYSMALLLPGLILHYLWPKPRALRKLLPLLGGLALSAAALYLFSRPFGMAYSTSALLSQGESFRSSLATLLFLSLKGSFAPADAIAIAKLVPAAAFVVCYVSLTIWYLSRRPGAQLHTLLHFGYYSIFLLLILIPHFLPWYVIWLLSIGVLLLDTPLVRRALLFSFTAFLSHIIYYFVWGIYGGQINYFTVEVAANLVIFAPPLLHWWHTRRHERVQLLAEKDRTIAAQETEIERLKALLAHQGRREGS